MKESPLIRNVLLFVLMWAFFACILITNFKLSSRSNLEVDLDDALKQLKNIVTSLEKTKARNKNMEEKINAYIRKNIELSRENKKTIDEFAGKVKTYVEDMTEKEREPHVEYEMLWRRVRNNIQELVKYVRYEIIKNSINLTEEAQTKVNSFLELIYEHKGSLLNDMDEMRKEDGYDKWRELESKRLSELIQKRFRYLQNPKNCSKAKKLVCDIRYCGFGCQMHHLVNCLTYAYGTGRVFVIQPKKWQYHKEGFDAVFMPISDTCTKDDSGTSVRWPAPEDVHIMTMNNTYMGDLKPIRPKFMPNAIPKDLEDRILKLHGYPPTYWVAQCIKFLYNLRSEVKDMLNEGMRGLGFKKPIVGVHIRRTDKVTTREGGFHTVEEYMREVDEYYNRLELREIVEKRRVYLATDDPGVIREAREKFPEYEILVNEDAAAVANYSQRYSEVSFRGLLLDVYLLSQTDHLVCTFSSHICRLCYESMQLLYPDAAHRYSTLEALWQTHEANPTKVEAIIPYYPNYPKGFNVNVGDILECHYWQNITFGFYTVNNTNLNITGMVPSYRVINKWEFVEFPTYPEADAL